MSMARTCGRRPMPRPGRSPASCATTGPCCGRALEAVNVLRRRREGAAGCQPDRRGGLLFRRHHGAGTGPCRCAVGRCGQPARWVGFTAAAQAGGSHPSVLELNGADDRSVTAEDIAGFQKEMDAPRSIGSSPTTAVRCTASPSATPTARRGASTTSGLPSARGRRWMSSFEERFEKR